MLYPLCLQGTDQTSSTSSGANRASDSSVRAALAQLVGTFDYTCSMPKLKRTQWALLPLILGTALLQGSDNASDKGSNKGSTTGSDQEVTQTPSAADACALMLNSACQLGVSEDEFRLLCKLLESDGCQV